jgi:dCMP deaminase
MNWTEYYMRHQYLASEKSKDPSTKIGAVLVRGDNIVSIGYNGFPRGINDSNERLANREEKYFYVVHAEANAILNAARNGIATKGSILYTSGMPCNECAKAIIQAGIDTVYIHSQYPSLSHGKWSKSVSKAQEMFEEAGVFVADFNKVLNIDCLINGEKVSV